MVHSYPRYCLCSFRPPRTRSRRPRTKCKFASASFTYLTYTRTKCKFASASFTNLTYIKTQTHSLPTNTAGSRRRRPKILRQTELYRAQRASRGRLLRLAREAQRSVDKAQRRRNRLKSHEKLRTVVADAFWQRRANSHELLSNP